MKQPALQLEGGDWLRDPQLSMCTPATRGIWIDLLCVLHELGRSGQVTGTPEQLCRACRCTPAEFVAAITELSATGTADVHERNGTVTIINRRMQREHKQRLMAAERVRRHRCSADVMAAVTPEKRQSNSEPEKSEKQIDIHVSSNQDSSGKENLATEELRSSVAAKKPQAAKPPKSPPDERLRHPAIAACRSVTAKYPHKSLWDRLIGVLGDDPDLLKMRECLQEWVKRGYNPNAWTWALDWYTSGIPGRNSNGKHSSNTGKDSGEGGASVLDQFQPAKTI